MTQTTTPGPPGPWFDGDASALLRAVEAAGVGSWQWAPDSDQMRWSPTCARLFGLPSDALGGARATLFGRVDPDDRERLLQSLDQALRDGVDGQQELAVIIDGGRTRWLHQRVRVERGPDGAARTLIGVVQDVTERRAAGQAPTEEWRPGEQLALQAAQAGVWSWDAVANTSSWDDRYHEQYGFHADEPRTFAAWLDRLHVDDREGVRARLEEMAQTPNDDRWQMEFRALHPTRGERWMQALGQAARDHDGRLVRMSGINLDITERRRSEEALRTGRERLQLALDAANLILFEWDIQRNEARRFYSTDPVLAPTAQDAPSTFEAVREVIHPEDRARFTRQIEAALRDPEGRYEAEHRLVHPDRSIAWLYERGHVERDALGQPTRLIGVAQDITKRKVAEIALRETVDRLDLAQQASNSGFFEWRIADGQAFLTGLLRRIAPADPLTGAISFPDWVAVVHPEDAARVASTTDAAFAARERELRYDFRVRTPAGEIWLSNRAMVEYDEAGQPSRVLGVNIDITERRRFEEALRTSEQHVRLLIEHTPAAVAMFDRDMRYLAVSRRWLQDYGLHDDIIGRSHYEVFPEIPERWKQVHRRCLAGAVESSDGDRFERADGSVLWLKWDVRPWRDAADVIGGLVMFAEDMTERTEAALALQRDAERRAVMLDVSRLVLGAVDAGAPLTEAVFARISRFLDADLCFNYRLEAGDILRLVACSGLPETLLPAAREFRLGQALCGTVAVTRTPLVADAARIAQDPRGAFIREIGARAYTCHPLQASDGQVMGTLAFASTRRDAFAPEDVEFLQTIAHFVAVAWERQRAEDQRAALLVQARAARTEAESAVRARDEFLSIAAHELLTPVTTLKGYAQNLVRARQYDRLSDERLARGLATIDDAAGRLGALTRDLLDIARLRTGRMPIRPVPLDIRALIDEVADRLRPRLGPAHRLLVDAARLPHAVAADRNRLEQVLTNLLDNAAKYSPDGGAISLTARPEAEGILIEVRDSGIGLPPGAAERIFQPFGRAANAERLAIEGMGLGLYIGRQIVERHGGRIWAASDGEGTGTAVSVFLPTAQPP